MKQAAWIVTLTMVGLLMVSPAALALTITPGRTMLRLTPGTQTDATIKVQNNHPDPLQIEVSKKDWFIAKWNQGFTVKKWLTIKGKTEFILQPGESRTIPIRVFCPKKVIGELVGMVSFAYQGMEVSMVQPVISVSVYVTATGTEKAGGEIKRVVPTLYKDALVVGAEVESTGNVHLRPHGRYTIRDEKEAVVAEFIVREGEPVYPGMTKGIMGAGPQMKLPAGRYTIQARLQSGAVQMEKKTHFVVKKDGSIELEEEAAPPLS